MWFHASVLSSKLFSPPGVSHSTYSLTNSYLPFEMHFRSHFFQEAFFECPNLFWFPLFILFPNSVLCIDGSVYVVGGIQLNVQENMFWT